MDLKNFLQSKTSKTVVCVIGAIIIALFILQAGIFIGYRKAAFSYRMGDNYYRNFGDRRGGDFMMMGIPRDSNFANPNGVIGKIIKIELPNLIVVDIDGIEKNVVIKNDTIVNRFKETIKPEDLKVDESIVVIGAANENGQIEAKLIRITPSTGTTGGPGFMMRSNNLPR